MLGRRERRQIERTQNTCDINVRQIHQHDGPNVSRQGSVSYNYPLGPQKPENATKYNLCIFHTAVLIEKYSSTPGVPSLALAKIPNKLA